MNRAALSLLGPSILGLSFWCAAGAVAPLDPASPDARLVVPASFLWFVGGFALGLVTARLRGHPLLATPALLTILPWLPLPLPAVVLLWTGKLAWVPPVLTLFAVAASRLIERGWHGLAPLSGRPIRSAALAAALTFGLSAAAAFVLAPRLPGGDEPHYLVITQSLLLDGDLRIENNHARRDYATYFTGTLTPDFLRRGDDGEIYSVHAPGVAALVLPLFAAFGYTGAALTIMLVTAVTGGLVWLAGWLATGDRGAAWFAWTAIAGGVTFLVQSVTVFPDGPGMLPVAAAVVAVLAIRRMPAAVSSRTLIVLGALLTALPWMHTRFAVLAAGLGILVTLALWRDRSALAGQRLRRCGAFLLVPIAGAVLWLAFFQILYGTLDPTAPYGDAAGTRLAYVPGGLAGLFFDGEFGLLTYAPVLACALLGWCARSRGDGLDAMRWGAAVLAAYLAAAATYWMWWAGVPATPARFATAALPLLAPALAVAWKRAGPPTRAIAILLLLITVAIAAVVIGVDRGALAWNARDARPEWLAWLGPSANITRGWPSFFWQLTPGVVSSELPLAAHVSIWVFTWTTTAGLIVWWSRRFGAVRQAAAAAWWVPVALMLALPAGWVVTGGPPLDASAAQMDILRGGLETAWRVSPFSVAPPDGGLPPRIQIPRTDVRDAPAARWAVLTNVPAGRYVLEVRARRPRAGRLELRIGDTPVERWSVNGLAAQRLVLNLPAGAARLLVTADDPLAGADPRVDLVLQQASPRGTQLALAGASYGPASVFFLDRGAFVERDAFWIRGADSAAMVIAVPDDRRRVTLGLTNGPVRNLVVVKTEAGERQVPLSPSAQERIDLPLGADGVADVQIRSESGFRPSDSGVSEDRRFLGVRATIEE